MGGRERGGLIDVSCHLQIPWDFSLGLQGREDWNSALPEIRTDQNQNSSSLPRGGDLSPVLSSG